MEMNLALLFDKFPVLMLAVGLLLVWQRLGQLSSRLSVLEALKESLVENTMASKQISHFIKWMAKQAGYGEPPPRIDD